MSNDNSFTSLENITFLINKLVNSENNNALPLKYIKWFFKFIKNYDIEIKVGADEQDDVKTFKAHSGILKTRCSLRQAALSNNYQMIVLFYLKREYFPKNIWSSFNVRLYIH